MKKLRLFYVLLFISVSAISQENQVNDTITRTAIIKYDVNRNEVNFTPETPELNQIAGAPKAFYTHYWEFGDGKYSTEETPKHSYKNKGEYEVKLWATNNYDTGKPPTTRPKKVAVNSATTDYEDVASMESDFELKRNREPIPNEEIVAILRYKNAKDYMTNGKLYMFYNEQKYKANNFELTDTRTHHGEKTVLEDGFVYTYNVDDDRTYLASSNDELIEASSVLQD